MEVVNKPRGLSRMNSRSALMDDSAWAARRYVIVEVVRRIVTNKNNSTISADEGCPR